MSSRWTPPDDLANVAVRPLDKGIIRNLAEQAMPVGSLLDSRNFIVGPNGLKRRPAYLRWMDDGSLVNYGENNDGPLQDIATVWKTAGTQLAVLIGDKFVYDLSATGYTAAYWVYDTGTVSISTTAATGSGTSWSGQDLKAGDIMAVRDSGGTVWEQWLTIASVTDNTNIVLSESGSTVSGRDYEIRRAFGANEPYLVDWTVADNLVIFADSSRFLYKYDGTTFTDYDVAITYVPTCVEYFADRLWIGRTIESSVDHRQRIRWTTTTDHTDFAAAQYLDLPYTQGIIKRLVGMGNLLVAYFDDAVFYGRYSNRTDIPYLFDRIETGTVGLVGMKAVTPWLDGHFFVGQDDIYFLSNEGLQRIGTPVVRDTIEACENTWRVYAAPDPQNDRIVFGFPGTNQEVERIWSFNYKAKAWSYDDVNTNMVAGLNLQEAITWSGLGSYAATWADMTTFPSWAAIKNSPSEKTLFFDRSGELFIQATGGTQDFASTSIQAVFETPDYDYGQPDIVKTWTRASLRIDRKFADDVVFSLEGSTDQGDTWTDLGTLTVDAGDREGYANFLIKGSVGRFRLTTITTVEPYVITEIVFRVKGEGLEVPGD